VYTDHGPLLSVNDDSESSNDNSKTVIGCQQSLLKLDDVPDSLMMPFFNIFKNKNISKQYDPAEAAYQKILEIVDELKQPDDLPYHETLEKYTILVNLLRVLNVDEYVELKQRFNIVTQMQEPKNSHLDGCSKLNDRKCDIRNIFYNAIAQAGTGPALLTIANWLKNENLDTVQMIQIISQIPNAARAPTPKYIKEFFVSIRLCTINKNEK